MMFAGVDSDTEKIISMIIKEIKSLKYSTSYVDYRSDSISSDVNEMHIRIMEDVLPKSPYQAIELLLKLLDTDENSICRAEEYDGEEAVDAFKQVCADLGHAYEYTVNSLDDVVDIVYKHLMKNDYGVYDKIVWHFKDTLADNGLSLLKEKLKKYRNKKNTSYIRLGLKDIADCQNDVDAYIKACVFHDKPSAKDHLEIAKRLIKHSSGIEAFQWLDSMDKTDSWGCRQDEHEALKIQALDLYSDYKAAQAKRLNWFETTLNPKVYSEILKNAKKYFIKSFKKTAIQNPLDFPDPLVTLTFLKEIQEFEPAAKLVRLKIDAIDGSHYATLRPIADVLCNIDPLAATLLYRQIIQPVLMGAESYFYKDKDAVKDLAICHSLSFKITDWHEFQNHQLYFEEVSSQNPHVALTCLKEIKEFEQAAKLVRLRFDTLDDGKEHDDTLRTIADALCKIDPLAATLLYRQMIQPVLNRAKTRFCYYGYAATDLARCHILSSKITDWKEYQNHQLYFEEVSRQLKKKTSFWCKYSSARREEEAKL